jgi:hypothetical protein
VRGRHDEANKDRENEPHVLPSESGSAAPKAAASAMDFEAPGFSRQALSRHEIPKRSPCPQRGAAPHQLRQICSPASRLAPNAHQSDPGSASEREAGEAGALNTVWQVALRFDFSRLRQATMASTFGIWDEQRRNTSGMQAARCSSVPRAKLGVEHVRQASAARTKLALPGIARNNLIARSPCCAESRSSISTSAGCSWCDERHGSLFLGLANGSAHQSAS